MDEFIGSGSPKSREVAFSILKLRRPCESCIDKKGISVILISLLTAIVSSWLRRFRLSEADLTRQAFHEFENDNIEVSDWFSRLSRKIVKSMGIRLIYISFGVAMTSSDKNAKRDPESGTHAYVADPLGHLFWIFLRCCLIGFLPRIFSSGSSSLFKFHLRIVYFRLQVQTATFRRVVRGEKFIVLHVYVL